jgi:DNA-binding PadR family transcriptional regulator
VPYETALCQTHESAYAVCGIGITSYYQLHPYAVADRVIKYSAGMMAPEISSILKSLDAMAKREWVISLKAGKRFSYQLTREGESALEMEIRRLKYIIKLDD